jgi:hypothetical protein
VTTSASRDGKRKKGRGSARPAPASKTRRKAPPRAPRPVVEEPAPEPVVEVEVESLPLPAVPLSAVETTFATRVPPPEPERPRPAGRRAIFLDVENTSKAQHLAHVIDHLGVDPWDRRTELIAVANWRVVGHDAARLLAQRGAHLVHSAPSTGVRDWSDLRIAVAAGIWLAAARPGDLIEIVSDDRAFDAVGDVATSLGIAFRRLSYRRLKEDTPEAAVATVVERAQPADASGSRRRRRRRGRGPASSHSAPGGQHRYVEPRSAQPSSSGQHPGRHGGSRGRSANVQPHRPPTPAPHTAVAPHTAPHDELVSVVRDLVEASPRRSVVIDAVANALKARGFQRPPGSPRLVTRLRRIREILVSPSGTITLAENGGVPPEGPRGERMAEAGSAESGPTDAAPVEVEPVQIEPAEEVDPDFDGQEIFLGRPGDEPEPPEIDGNRRAPEIDGNRPPPPGQGRRRRRRRRRGGQRRPAPGPQIA